MISKTSDTFEVREAAEYWIIDFAAMASPCEVLIRCKNASEADELASLAFNETKRIERKYSRYRDDNIVYKINNSQGEPVPIDEETQQLFHYADQLFNLSDGAFDITSGVLRRAWTFNGQNVNPDQKLIDTLLTSVGWQKVTLNTDTFVVLPGMEIDLGGIGKEYAVDKVADLLFKELSVPLMVNFGGDIRAFAAGDSDEPWIVGVEDPTHEDGAVGTVSLAHGAIATSGDSRRYCMYEGKRLGHILDPRTGWPVAYAPRSVTVIADFCLEAGFLATMAMLHGADAETFLAGQEVAHHCIR
jgi:thiamine biosynthesis lipoprotein